MGRSSNKAGGALPVTAALTSLGPGFRFHPTDEELVSYYLKRKVLSKTMCSDVIGEVDIYKHEPSELAVRSKLKTRDQEWFFFSTLDKKNPTGTNVNRATKEGYWKVTGKERKICRGDGQKIGMVKTLVFYSGCHRRTNWLIHEYRLVKTDQIPKEIQIDAYVLCKVFLKKNYGRPNGSTYAPFLEQEWDDDDGRAVISVPVVGDANQIQQEDQSQSKNLIDLNELPKEFENNDDMNEKDDDEPVKKGSAEKLPCCVLNKEAPLPLIRYKRKSKTNAIGNSNCSSQTTQDHCSSTDTINDITDSLLELSNQLAMKEAETEPADTLIMHESSSTKMINEQEPVVPATSSTELINHLLEYKGTLNVDMMIDELTEEEEE